MFINFLLQFAIELIRALLIDGLSDHVRTRLARARRTRRLRTYLKLRSAPPRKVIRKLSTPEDKKVE